MYVLLIGLLSFGLVFFIYRLTVLSRRLSRFKKLLAKAEMQCEHENVRQQTLSSELVELHERIKLNVLTDPITELPSRQVIAGHLEQLIHQSHRYQLMFAALFVDLDEFKVINSALGYEIGDQLLHMIADKLLTCTRKIDRVARFSGNTFLILLPQLTKPERAAYVAKRILDVIAEPCVLKDQQELFLTASIGIAIYPNDGTDVNTLLKSTDNALHQARVRGGNAYQFYQQQMQSMGRRELTLISSLRSASIFQDFLIYYQPVVDLRTKKITSMEALLRWKHPDFGIISPQEFLRLAENSGKILAIGEWVLQSACEQLQRWRLNNFAPQTVSVNISFRQLESPHFVYKLTQAVHSLGLEPSCLMLEIAETTLTTNTDIVEKSLHLLKQLGVKITIDNFGTGSLSLQQLRKFPIDMLKLDASLIWDITVNPESIAMIKAIMALAQSLQWDVIVKGVETNEQKETLSKIHGYLMQGYLFARPALAEEFSVESERTMGGVL